MKSLSVRLSVLALALTGFTASTVASKAAPKHNVTPSAVAMGTTPAALCPISRPTLCLPDWRESCTCICLLSHLV